MNARVARQLSASSSPAWLLFRGHVVGKEALEIQAKCWQTSYSPEAVLYSVWKPEEGLQDCADDIDADCNCKRDNQPVLYMIARGEYTLTSSSNSGILLVAEMCEDDHETLHNPGFQHQIS